eukprot:TRINITY_DN5881_c0_g1_i2.p1 TRINITY_DN5881_c0_g1~~TRINITY_DN5881_c0_g1_i2.p1  ORF type:complete len:390 (+),score=90.15 TRINITY_DN5881_c0_g1_i2:54-1172(+)
MATGEQVSNSKSGAFSVTLNGYLAKSNDNFPHINQITDTHSATFEGTPDDYLVKHNNDSALNRQMKNKVKKCPQCNKPNAFTLTVCNGCGYPDLGKVDISYTNNIFSSFVYGIQKGPFPFTVSLRYQSPEYMVFDDLLSLAPCHLNIIPTNKYIPDWRYLLTRPKEGLQIVEDLFNNCFSVLQKQFLGNEDFKNKIYNFSDITEEALRGHIAAGFNFPPSQYQLHLQFIVPPMIPFQYHLYLQGVHFTPNRFFPIEYVREVLKLVESEKIEFKIDDDQPIEALIQGDSHRKLAKWDVKDFELYVVGNKAYKANQDGTIGEEASGVDIKAINAEDKNRLQNYGRPYSTGEKVAPTGTYYGHPKSFDQKNVEIW